MHSTETQLIDYMVKRKQEKEDILALKIALIQILMGFRETQIRLMIANERRLIID